MIQNGQDKLLAFCILYLGSLILQKEIYEQAFALIKLYWKARDQPEVIHQIFL